MIAVPFQATEVEMPSGWSRIGTPNDLKQLLSDPPRFKREVNGRVGRSGATLHEVYFEARGGPAYVLVGIPQGNQDAVVDSLAQEFGSNVTVLYTIEEL